MVFTPKDYWKYRSLNTKREIVFNHNINVFKFNK